MHAGNNVETRFEGFDQSRDPGARNDAARVGDADNERARAGRLGRGGIHFRQANAEAAGQDEFTDAMFERPVAQTERGLGVPDLCDIAEKEEVRMRQFDHAACSGFQSAPTRRAGAAAASTGLTPSATAISCASVPLHTESTRQAPSPAAI